MILLAAGPTAAIGVVPEKERLGQAKAKKLWTDCLFECTYIVGVEVYPAMTIIF